LAKKIIEYRSFSKLKNTYVDALLTLLAPNHKRVHTSFSLTSTNTGRLASSDPNLQNIPIRSDAGKEIRKAFIAKDGYKLVCADYSQIELRLMADVADVKLLREALINNEDIHATTASQVFGIPLNEIDTDTRRRAKAINFGIVYGISAFGLSNQLGISRSDAKKYIDAYFDKYPQIKTYMDKTIAFAHEHEYVETPFGRKCYVYGINDKMLRSFAERAAINAPIQGGAADIIKLAMIKLNKELKQSNLDATLLLQVHDELIFEVADKDIEDTVKLIKNAMENVIQLSVPLIAEVGVGNNWKEAH
jgi:DNA polymerase-1